MSKISPHFKFRPYFTLPELEYLYSLAKKENLSKDTGIERYLRLTIQDIKDERIKPSHARVGIIAERLGFSEEERKGEEGKEGEKSNVISLAFPEKEWEQTCREQGLDPLTGTPTLSPPTLTLVVPSSSTEGKEGNPS